MGVSEELNTPGFERKFGYWIRPLKVYVANPQEVKNHKRHNRRQRRVVAGSRDNQTGE
jgi:hypothetical protein